MWAPLSVSWRQLVGGSHTVPALLWANQCALVGSPWPLTVAARYTAGGVVGGVGGALLIAGLAFVIIRKRRAAATAGGGAYGGHGGGVTASITTGAGLSVKTRASRLGEDQGYSSSPRNNLTPRTRVGGMA